MPPKLKPSTQEPSTTGGTEPSEADEESLRIAGLGYEEARDELLDVVRRLETGGTPLEESLTLWERGEALADRCQTILDGARARLDAARSGADEE